MRVPTLWLATCVAVVGCVLPPREAAHPRPLTDDRVGLSGAMVEPAADGWWNSFQDPQLDRLIRLSAQDSPTLAQAQARVGAALAQAQSARAGLLPTANLDASALYQRAPENYLVPPPLAGHSFWMGQAGASLGWDVDFWGRLSAGADGGTCHPLCLRKLSFDQSSADRKTPTPSSSPRANNIRCGQASKLHGLFFRDFFAGDHIFASKVQHTDSDRHFF